MSAKDQPMVIVLETAGKHEDVNYASVRLFATEQEASQYVKSVCTGKQKYWIHAQIMKDGEEIELCQPEDER